MRLDALKHLAGAIRQMADFERLVVFGSASLLASHPKLGSDHGGPLERTNDADVIGFPFDEDLAMMLDKTFGEDRPFQHQFGYYADIIRPIATEQFPKGWEERLVPLEDVERVFCLEPHDMAAAKCQAGREKDLDLLAYLIRNGHLDPALVKERLFKVEMREARIVKSHRALDEAAERAKEE